MSQIYDDFKVFQDQYGLNQLDPNSTSQNGALFTMEYLITLLGDDTATPEEKQSEIARLIEVYKTLERFPGVSVRYPNDLEFDSMDNTGAIAAFSGIHDNGGYSQRSYEHGSTTRAQGIDQGQSADQNNKYYWIARLVNFGFPPRFFWNNNNPTLFCFPGWHGRSPGHVAFLKMTAGKFVGPLGFLSVLVGQFIGCFANTGNTDARKLPYVAWQFLKNRSFIWKLFYKLWCYILIKQYGPEGMLAVYKIYYGNPNHPMRKYPKPYLP